MINERVIVNYLNNNDDLVFYVGSDVYIMRRDVFWGLVIKYKLLKNNHPLLQVKTNSLNFKKNKISIIANDLEDLNDFEFISSNVYFYKNRKLHCKFCLFKKIRIRLYIDHLEVGNGFYTQPWFGQESQYDIDLFIPDEFLLPFLILISQVIPLTP